MEHLTVHSIHRWARLECSHGRGRARVVHYSKVLYFDVKTHTNVEEHRFVSIAVDGIYDVFGASSAGV